MKMLTWAALALYAASAPPARAAPTIPQVQNAGAAAVPAYQVQDQLQLAAGNTATTGQPVFGGTYIFAQMANSGTVALQVLGPDGATWETIVSKTSSDTAGGTAVQLQGGAIVRALLTGTAGAVATLGRVP